MNLRLVKIFIPVSEKSTVEEILREQSATDFWHDRMADKKLVTRVLVSARKVEGILDALEDKLEGKADFRAVILPVEGAIPRKKAQEKEEGEEQNKGEKGRSSSRISREELYSSISRGIKLDWIFVSLIVFASVVAAVGVVYGNVPMIMGAMIIAPLLGPCVGLSFATTLGDTVLALKSLSLILIGVAIALAFSALVGFVFPFDPQFPEIFMRSNVTWADPIVSLISGSVGVLSYTTATLTSLAGVMIAVALLPPLVVWGMLLGAGELGLAGGAALLFLVNLVGINLAGVVTFVVNKIRPRTFLEEWRAKRFTFLALEVWIFLFLLILIYLLLRVF